MSAPAPGRIPTNTPMNEERAIVTRRDLISAHVGRMRQRSVSRSSTRCTFACASSHMRSACETENSPITTGTKSKPAVRAVNPKT